MLWSFTDMAKLFQNKSNSVLLGRAKFGLEKESLRVNENGTLALTEHPKSFGDKFVHPYITTDYSESQLEFITPPCNTIEESVHFLEQTHIWAYNNLEKEFLWPLSMPCILPDEADIPIAKYGNTNEAQIKEIYRKGLALRYGKKMQLICGIHYNFSLNDELLEMVSQHFFQSSLTGEIKNQLYFSLARNFLRYRWLLVYLFGASPVVDNSYEPEVLEKLEQLGCSCPYLSEPIYYKKYATSLRMSKFGYSNTHQQDFVFSYNNLSEYIADIKQGMNTPVDKYTKLGIYNTQGEQIQLNDNLLQLESEYYAPIRFKALIDNNERQIDALEKKGINHIEIRTLDINPFSATGVVLDEMYFMHIFMIFCLWEESKNINISEQECINKNQRLVALRGRQKNLKLYKCNNTSLTLTEWSEQIFEKLEVITQILDSESEGKYNQSLNAQKQKLYDVQLLPSQKIINSMCTKNKQSLTYFAMQQAQKNKDIISKLASDQKIQNILNSVL